MLFVTWTQQRLSQKCVCCQGRVELGYTSKKIEGSWQRIPRVWILYLGDFLSIFFKKVNLRKQSGSFIWKPWNLLQKPHNMEYTWPSIPSGNASSGHSSLVPPCGTQATSHVVALGKTSAVNRADRFSFQEWKLNLQDWRAYMSFRF